MKRLGELERAAMDVLWDRDEPIAVREVVRALADRDLACTTVMTVLNRLVKKGFVRREAGEGRAWYYAPVAGREQYVARLMLDALSLTGDRETALAHFAQSMSAPEAEALSQALDER